MRLLRILICICFAASVALFGYYEYTTNLSVDKTPPVIKADSDEISVSVNATDEDLLEGMVARDAHDGDITDQITINSLSRFTEPGVREISYIVFDSANNPATYERTIRYSDYEPTKITLSEPLRFTCSQILTADPLELVTAEDMIDGDLTDSVSCSWADTYTTDPGDYEIIFSVTNSAGDTRTIQTFYTIYDATDGLQSKRYFPVLSDYIIYIKVGEEVDLSQYLIGIEHNGTYYPFPEAETELGTLQANVTVTSEDIEWGVPGTYSIQYTYTSGVNREENPTPATTNLIVVVEE